MRHARWEEEQQILRRLPTMPLAPCRELRMTVGRFGTIAVWGNTYSVPSRLIGTLIVVRVRSESLEVYVGSQKTVALPRLIGKGNAAIRYQDLMWSLVRKPGAFAQYRHRDAFFPTLAFRQWYDALLLAMPGRADKEYLHILHLVAGTSEAEVMAALDLLHDADQLPTFDQVRALVQPAPVPTLPPITIDLHPDDGLLEVANG